jgi:hypothetical protein
MPVPGSIKPKHKAIAEYHDALRAKNAGAMKNSSPTFRGGRTA